MTEQLIADMAAFMGWKWHPARECVPAYWETPERVKGGYEVRPAWNPALNPADCKQVKDRWLENPRHEYTTRGYWLETGKQYSVELVDYDNLSKDHGHSEISEEHAFCLAVKAHGGAR
jgi:hypothetical protein